MTGHRTNATGGSSPPEENIMYKKDKALCPDGKVRTVHHGDADSYLAASAWTKVRRKYVGGFVISRSAVDLPPTMFEKAKFQFVPYSRFDHLMPDTLKSTKAIWSKTFPHALPPIYRWIWERF